MLNYNCGHVALSIRIIFCILPSPGMTRTRDKYRVVYTSKQRAGLEKEYNNNKFLTCVRRADISKTLDLSERQVRMTMIFRMSPKHFSKLLLHRIHLRKTVSILYKPCLIILNPRTMYIVSLVLVTTGGHVCDAGAYS